MDDLDAQIVAFTYQIEAIVTEVLRLLDMAETRITSLIEKYGISMEDGSHFVLLFAMIRRALEGENG